MNQLQLLGYMTAFGSALLMLGGIGMYVAGAVTEHCRLKKQKDRG